ncbi:MAG: type II secretion system protein [bacterium]
MQMASMKNGFTLIELMVAVTLFAFATVITSGVSVTAISSQKKALAQQEVLDQVSFLMEYMSRSVRMAQKDLSGENYAFSGQCLNFLNYKNQDQQFCLDGTRLKNENNEYLTSDNLKISSFNVVLSGQSQADDLQPRITFSLEVEGQNQVKMIIQTTVSQRNLDIKI